MLSSDNALRDDSQNSGSDLKFNQPPKLKEKAQAMSVVRLHEETDSVNNFGDVDDFEHASSDNTGQPKLSMSSTSSAAAKPHFLIKSLEYLSGYKERVLGE